jgi:hypothetical protein
VTGESYGGSTSQNDYATVKYNTAGLLQWVARYDGPGHGDDYPKAVAVDMQGNVFVTGAATSLTDIDYATIKYNNCGTQQWVRYYNGPSNAIDRAFGIDLDASGNIYVSGRSPAASTGDDYATVRYDSLGTEQWVRRLSGTGSCGGLPTAITLDQDGNAYVSGVNSINSWISEYVTAKYDSAGTEQWNNRYRY